MFKKMIGLAAAIALTATLFTGCGQQNQMPNASTPLPAVFRKTEN